MFLIFEMWISRVARSSTEATILYFTIVGLTAMVKNDYDLAQFYLNAANRVDVDCLRIPLADQPHPVGSFKVTQ